MSTLLGEDRIAFLKSARSLGEETATDLLDVAFILPQIKPNDTYLHGAKECKVVSVNPSEFSIVIRSNDGEQDEITPYNLHVLGNGIFAED